MSSVSLITCSTVLLLHDARFLYPCALHAVGHKHAEPVLTFLAEENQNFGIKRMWSRSFTGFE